MSRSTSAQAASSLVEHSSLPKITIKARGDVAQLQAYVNAYIVGTQKAFMNGQWTTPLYYLSLVAMKGQGTTLQAVFARLVSTHPKGIFLEGVGEIALAHHQVSLADCGYALHWNFEQAEVLPTHDLHAVIESRMLTVCDPVRGMALKQREQHTARDRQATRRKERVSLSTVKQSKMQQSLAELRNRERSPLFLLMVPGSAQGDASFLHLLHLSFLDLRVPWPLDPSWASFLWERGFRRQEIERLKVWCYTPPGAGEGDIEDDGQVLQEESASPLLAEAYFCRPNPTRIYRDLQEALLSGQLSPQVHSHLVALPSNPERREEEVAIAAAG
jgi:hypothetical protein